MITAFGDVVDPLLRLEMFTGWQDGIYGNAKAKYKRHGVWALVQLYGNDHLDGNKSRVQVEGLIHLVLNA